MTWLDAFLDFWGNIFDYFRMFVDTLLSFVTTTLHAVPWYAQAVARVPVYLNIFPRHITFFFGSALALIVLWQFLDKD